MNIAENLMIKSQMFKKIETDLKRELEVVSHSPGSKIWLQVNANVAS